MPQLQPAPARRYGLRAEDVLHGDHRRVDRVVPGRPQLTRGNEINDPDSLDFIRLFDLDGEPIPLDSEEAEADGRPRRAPDHRSPRGCEAIYGTSTNVDAFTGMVAEPHVPGTDFGELQRADLAQGSSRRCATATGSSTATTRP